MSEGANKKFKKQVLNYDPLDLLKRTRNLWKKRMEEVVEKIKVILFLISILSLYNSLKFIS